MSVNRVLLLVASVAYGVFTIGYFMFFTNVCDSHASIKNRKY